MLIDAGLLTIDDVVSMKNMIIGLDLKNSVHKKTLYGSKQYLTPSQDQKIKDKIIAKKKVHGKKKVLN